MPKSESPSLQETPKTHISAEMSQQLAPRKNHRARFSKQEAETARLAYDGLIGDDKEMMALRYGFDGQVPHTYAELGKIYGKSEKWASCHMSNLHPGYKPKKKSKEKPKKWEEEALSREDKLAIILPRLGATELQIALRHYGLPPYQACSVQEINHQLFHNTPMGEQKIRGLIKAVEWEISHFENLLA